MANKFCLLILLVFYSISLSMSKRRSRSILIGIDGFLKKCLNESKHDAFDYLMQQGSSTLIARTTILAISAPGWSNILCGLPIEVTGILTNEWVPSWKNASQNNLSSLFRDKPFPCIFSELKQSDKYLQVKAAAAFDWEWFSNFTNSSTENTHLDEIYFCNPSDWTNETQLVTCDNQVKNNTIRMIQSKEFDFIFTYFLSLDDVGHYRGFCSEKYTERLSGINDYINEIIVELKKQKLDEETYVFVVTDHGADYHGYDHGTPNTDNVEIPMFVMGPGIKKGHSLERFVMNEDVAPTIMELMKLKPNKVWRGHSFADEIQKSLK